MSPSKQRVFKFLHELHEAPVEAVEALSEGQALMVGNDLEDACRALSGALKAKQPKCDWCRGNGVCKEPDSGGEYTCPECDGSGKAKVGTRSAWR